MTRASFDGKLPDSFKSEIFEYPDDTFDLWVAYKRRRPNWNRHIIASTLAGDDKDTVLTDDGRIACGSEVTSENEGMAQDVF
jgi:hypothetical protein